MVAVCQTCGDRGFSVALIYCDKCQAYAVHRYCLYNLPKSFEEYVFWFCVDCEPKVMESSRESRGKNGIKLKKMKRKKKKKKKENKYDSGSLALVEVERQSSPLLRPIENLEKDETLRGSPRVCGPSSSEEARLIESKNKYDSGLLALVEVERQSSPLLRPIENPEKDETTLRGSLRVCGPSSSEEARLVESKNKYESDSLALVEVERQSSPLLRPIENPEKDETLRGSPRVCGPSPSEEARLIESKSSPLKSCSHSRGSDLINIDDGAGCVNNSMSIVAVSEDLNTTEHNFPDPVATNNQMPMHTYVPAQPVFESIWRGSFHTAVENLTIGVVAHLSSLACLKVCKTARCLPQLLQIELLPRCDLWPKGFKQAGPSDESIALYFFPINERDANIFYGLMDTMIYQDLGIRVVIQDVELLVYSSNVLPVHSQRFQEKFYLWGVFRAKQPSHLTNGVRGEETSIAKALTRDSRSPLSVNGSHDSMRPVPTQNQSQETCEHCHDSHPGKCWKLTGACLKCGSKNHFVRDCPKMVSGARTSAQKCTPIASKGRGFGRGSFIRLPSCKHCHAKHRGKCRRMTNACLRCGLKDHFVRDCPKRHS